MNQAYCDIYGYRRDELVGQHFTILIPAELRGELASRYDQSIAAGEDCASTRPAFRRDGSPIHVAVTTSVVVAETGERFKIVTAQDVTARVRVQEALQATLSRLAEAERIVHMGHWESDLVRGEEHWSNEIYRLIGLEPGAIAPSCAAFRERVHPDDRAALDHARESALRGAGPLDVVFRTVPGGGTVRILHARGEVSRGADGTPCCMIGTVLDITERVAAEQALRESEERFRVALATMPIVAFNQDSALRYTWVHNPNHRTVAEILGRTDRELLPGEAARLLEDLKRRVLETGIGIRREVTFRLAEDAPEEHYDLTLEPVRDAAGAVTGLTGAAVNVTEDRRTKEALEAARAEAEKASASKTRFLAVASHDLRQPLQACILFQDLLARRNRDPALGEIIAKLGQSLGGLQDLFNQLLDISRLDTGTVKVEGRDFAVGALLGDLVREMRPQAEAGGLSLRLVGSRQMVHSDPALLQRILRNLLDNAIKYTSRGRILLGCRRSGGSLRIQVWDTGIGIPPERLPTVFEEFRQLDTPGAPAGGRGRGLGLGLAIVDRLARLLGHEVAVRSVPGRGSCFEVRVPVAAPPARAPAAEPAAEAPAARLVAVIDDGHEVREALQLCLEAAGYAVVAAATGAEVLDGLHRLARAPDAIIVGGRARGVGGRDAVRAIRDEWQQPIPGILLDGDGAADRPREARDGGFFLLRKPVSAEALIGLLAEVLAEPQPGGPACAAGRNGRRPAAGPGDAGRGARGGGSASLH